MIEHLEPRRMLAVFNGTNGADTIVIRRTSDGVTHVQINGGAVQDTADQAVFVDAMGGNDSVYFPELRHFAPQERFLQIVLGAGDDLASNYDPVTHTASLDGLDYHHDAPLILFAGAGNDTLELDGTDSTFGRDFRFEPTTAPHAIVRISQPGFQGIRYDSDLENCAIEGTPFGDHFQLDRKLGSLKTTISSFEGSDSFNVGFGDFETFGWSLANTTLSGGAGTDHITFDETAGNESAAYAFDVFTLTTGTWGFNYNSFESQEFKAPNINTAGSNTINLNAFSGQIESTVIVGGSNRSNAINFGSGSFTGLSGTTTLGLGGPGDIVNFNAQSATGPRTFVLSADQLTSPAAVNFTGVEEINISTGSFNDNISITGSALGTAVGVSTNLGNDIVSIGGGDFDNMRSAVAVNGAGGDDLIRFLGNSDSDLFTATLRNNSFVAGGLTHSHLNFETLDVRSGPGGSNLTIQSVPLLTPPAVSVTNFTGGDGDDRVTIGTGNVLIGGNVTVSGGSGSDTLVLNDSSGTSAASYTFDQGNRFFKTGPVLFTVVRSGFERTILDANGGNNTITVDRTTSELTILANAGNDTINVLDSTVPVTVDTGSETSSASAPFGDSIAINTDFGTPGDTPATVLIDQSDTILGLTLAQLGVLRIASGAVLARSTGTGSVFSLTGTLDLAGGALLSRAGGSTAAQFRTWISQGFNNGAWNGTNAGGAINSSLAHDSALADAVGYGLGSEIGISSIGGLAIAPGDMLLRYTYYGDADLNGKVDFDDYARIDLGFQQHRTGWVNGDFNYSNAIDFDDYALIDVAFNTQGTPLRPGSIGGDAFDALLSIRFSAGSIERSDKRG